MNDRYLTVQEAASLNCLSPGNQAYGLGSKLKAALDVLGVVGRRVYLDPTNGNDGNDGLSKDSAVKTFPIGYALLRDGMGDILTYIAGTSGLTLSAAVVWAKSYTHFEGVCAPSHSSPRARIFQLATLTGVGVLLKNTGAGNMFVNLEVFQGVNDATSLIPFEDAGRCTVCLGCHFAGIGNATQDTAGAASMSVNGAEEGTYIDCNIGLQTQATRGSSSTELVLQGGAKNLKFVDCKIQAKISNAGHALVTVSGATGIDDLVEFTRTKFIANSVNRATALTSVFSIPVIAQGMILLDDCKVAAFGAAPAWDSNTRGIVLNNAVAAAATAAGGKMTIV